MKSVHYMVRLTKSGKAGVVYPTELQSENFQGFGELFVLGDEGSDVDSEYRVPAVIGEQLAVYTARRLQDNWMAFVIDAAPVGMFICQLQRLQRSLPYLGENPPEDGGFALYRVRFLRDDLLERAVRDHQFYFVGQSPMTEALGA